MDRTSSIKTLSIYFLGVFFLSLFLFSMPGWGDAASYKQSEHLTAIQKQRINRMVAKMTLREKVGQMIMCSIIGNKMQPRLRKFLRDVQPGGITIFTYNIKSPTQLRQLNRSIYQQMSAVPPFIAIDQEGGMVTRIKKEIPELPGNMALGAARSESLSRRAGEVLGEGLSAYGFNMNLAPVLDINTNPKNPVIGTRSFSSDARLVGNLGSALIDGMQSKGIVAVGKHFPGHGDTSGDSHAKLPVLLLNSKRLRERELVPFLVAINKGRLNVIMTAHIALPGLHKGKSIPATLSRLVLTNILRRQMNYDGIILTDGLEMKGLIKTVGTIARASVRAVKAGADMISINADPLAVYQARNAIERAVRQGKIPMRSIDNSVKRILATKLHYKILDYPIRTYVPSAAQQRRFDKVVLDLSLQSATLVRNRSNVLPITAKKYNRALVIGPHAFISRFQSTTKGIKVYKLHFGKGVSTKQIISRAKAFAGQKIDIAVVVIRHKGDISIVSALRKYLRKPIAVVNLGSPYVLKKLPWVEAILCMFGNTRTTNIVAADMIGGRAVPVGKLPVKIPGLYPFGHSLTYSTIQEKDARFSRLQAFE